MNAPRHRGIGLSYDAFAATFPFHIVFNRELRIVQAGEVVRRTAGNVQVGTALDAAVRIVRPTVSISFDAIREHDHALFMLAVHGTNLLLKGQMIYLPGTDTLVFVGSPWVLEMAQMQQLGLTLSDFAIHDPITDFLFLLQAKNTALGDAQTLSQQLKLQREELKRSNQALQEERGRLEDKVVLRTRELSLANAVLLKKEMLLKEDLAQARSFQQSILPKLPDASMLDFGIGYRPASMVGGDIYDVAQLDERHFRAFLADATGHGVQASLRTMILKSEYDRLKCECSSPARLLTALNHRLLTSYSGTDLHCTAVCFDLVVAGDGRAHVTCARSAHPPLLHLRGEETIERSVPGPFFGLTENVEFPMIEFDLLPGERLLAYSDGLTEQLGAGDEEFGESRVLHEARMSNDGAQAVVGRIIAAFERFLADGEQADDVTLIAIGSSPVTKQGIRR